MLAGLTAFTNYSVRVAFVNMNGTGPFSEEIFVTTSQAGECVHVYLPEWLTCLY